MEIIGECYCLVAEWQLVEGRGFPSLTLLLPRVAFLLLLMGLMMSSTEGQELGTVYQPSCHT